MIAMLAVAAVVAVPQPKPAPLKTENVILVMWDGLRRDEMFGGVDPALIKDVDTNARHYRAYWRETAVERRAALLPTMWSLIAQNGQLYGNWMRGSVSQVTNGLKFSYPGYSETLCGFPDPRVNSNAATPNPNVTVFEWLHSKSRFKGKVAAFGNWHNVTQAILNSARAGFYVNGGEAVTHGKLSSEAKLLNRLKREIDPRWDPEGADALVFHSAMEYIKANKPRLFFLLLGETDEYAHEGNYPLYLNAANRCDAYLREMWETLQRMPQYRGKTTLIVTADHGRGDGKSGWSNHGESVVGAEFTWIAFIGPDTPALGEMRNVPAVTNSQIAATITALLGEDYNAAQPKAGQPILSAIRPTRR